jgi:hypothetical protein
MLPRKLYRVQHARARASFNEDGDLMASLLSYTPTSILRWRESLTIHFQWERQHTDTPFISCVDNLWRALEWSEDVARKRQAGDAHVVLYVVDTALCECSMSLTNMSVDDVDCTSQQQRVITDRSHFRYTAEETAVFHAKSSLQGLAMDMQIGSHEYLLMHRVPAPAYVPSTSKGSIPSSSHIGMARPHRINHRGSRSPAEIKLPTYPPVTRPPTLTHPANDTESQP